MFMRTYKELFRHDQWNVGIVQEPISAFLKQDVKHVVRWLPSVGKTKFLADAFGIVRGEKIYIFCEEYDYRTGKGRIVCVEATGDSTSRPVIVLELPCHVSYPYLFEDDDGIYCVPETAQAGEVALYKSVDFPYTWQKVATLISDFAGHDGTIFRHEDTWWLACTGAGPDEVFSDLFLWYSSSLFGPWKPHAANPVKKDLSSSRPAGTPFVHEGHLFRPAQDCTRTYGGRVILNRITNLTPTHFAEEKAAVIEPFSTGPYPDGVHTISAVGNITLVDGKRYRFQKSAFKSALGKENLGQILRGR